MIGYENILQNNPAELCMVVGDVNSTMACSIVAKKMGLKVAHVEAGIRSKDMYMPEEINRIVTDSITDYFFTTSELANQNLIKTGISPDDIFFVGNTMIDTLLKRKKYFKKPDIWDKISLSRNNFIIMTLHRPSNVDNNKKFKNLENNILDLTFDTPIIFPIHPRIKRHLNYLNSLSSKLHVIKPMGYLEFNYLVERSKAVITDSGGITEETTVMNIPCLTLRENTERPETIQYGTNELLGTNSDLIRKAIKKIYSVEWKRGFPPPLWDGKTADRITRHLLLINLK